MITIIDYDAGNIRSVENALKRLGAEYEFSDDPVKIASASKLLLPGVGNCGRAVESLRSKGLESVIRSFRRPVLGICVGMQVLCRSSEEDMERGLGIFDARVKRFVPQGGDKVPHCGWNSLHNLDGKLFKGVENGSFCYFVHSYYAPLCSDTIATCRHSGVLFSAALKYENFYGCQFHPEKSADTGELILKNFLSL